MIPGTFATLTIDEQVDYGYFLTDGKDRVLLHNNEVIGEVEEGEKVEVFFGVDAQDRLYATMKKPFITQDTYGWVEVVDIVEDMGAFVDIGLSKDALVAKDHLPYLREVWPNVGDKLYCTLKVSKNGRFFVRLATEEIVEPFFKNADRALFNKEVTGTVYRMIVAGSFILTEEGYKGFIHSSQREVEPRLGETVTGRVIDVKEDGTINVSLLPRKHEAQGSDAERIYAYMQDRNGAMPFTDKSDPDDIKERFNLSKGAFKRALGLLMKNNRVYQKDGWTYFKEEENNQ
ncbi:S1-like domain-containing RNA-binding protein [Metabacillus litoralis]|nr:S1-like domain-containing RNA-binding protein [Metabacillus litoralis]MCM3160936.1 S1-like domain-containing RNA-binding protein [Metabacillus litoralis]MCM3411995.1 S1-like domain-containing RNA-binding protein [Metabacillus litoralis]UHA60292.1 S1-like domain-containing RNA-binding protein [Metabacillus litoralis]